LYPEQIYSCPKKSGKTSFAAMHSLIMVLLFGGSYAEATLCANDLDQAQSRVFRMAKRIIECSPELRAEARLLSDRIEFPTLGASITAIGSDFAGAAGGNQNIAVFDELWGYTSERSRRLWDEMIPPPTRKMACRFTCTYAGFEGESALLQDLYKRGLKQPQIGKSLYGGDGLLMFWSHVPIAPWQDQEWLEEMRRGLRPLQFLRMIENRFVASESTFIDMAWWDACTDPSAGPLLSNKGLSIWLGVDASMKHDSTAVVACACDGKKVRLIGASVFQPTRNEPLDFEDTVVRTVLGFHHRFHVREVLFDPYQMQAVSQRLAGQGVPMREFPQSIPNITESSSNLYDLIKGRNLIVYEDPAMRLAVQRCVAVEMPRGWRIAKEKNSHRIDVVVALGMAALGAAQGGTQAAWFNTDVARKLAQRSAMMGRLPPSAQFHLLNSNVTPPPKYPSQRNPNLTPRIEPPPPKLCEYGHENYDDEIGCEECRRVDALLSDPVDDLVD
jgi:hypothetical protein